MENFHDLFFIGLEKVNVVCRKIIGMINMCSKGIPSYINKLE